MVSVAACAVVAAGFGVVLAPEAQAYRSCDEARAAGAAPLYAGQPGYSRNLDRDGDGVACETGGGGYVPVPMVPAPNTALPAAPVLAPAPTVAPAPAAAPPTETCDDWGKLRLDPATGQEQVCGAITSPATVWYWIAAAEMPGGVHDAGSTCPYVPLFTFARSTDNYQIWCATGTSVYLPGNKTVTNPPIPIWGLYSP